MVLSRYPPPPPEAWSGFAYICADVTLEAPPSIYPAKKYCDFTGLPVGVSFFPPTLLLPCSCDARSSSYLHGLHARPCLYERTQALAHHCTHEGLWPRKAGQMCQGGAAVLWDAGSCFKAVLLTHSHTT